MAAAKVAVVVQERERREQGAKRSSAAETEVGPSGPMVARMSCGGKSAVTAAHHLCSNAMFLEKKILHLVCTLGKTLCHFSETRLHCP